MKNFSGRIIFSRVLLEGFFESFKGTFFFTGQFPPFFTCSISFFYREKQTKKKLGRVNSYSKIGDQYYIESEQLY